MEEWRKGWIRENCQRSRDVRLEKVARAVVRWQSRWIDEVALEALRDVLLYGRPVMTEWYEADGQD